MKHSLTDKIESLEAEVKDLNIIISVLDCYVCDEDKKTIRKEIDNIRNEVKKWVNPKQ